jgi:hypothetical protein
VAVAALEVVVVEATEVVLVPPLVEEAVPGTPMDWSQKDTLQTLRVTYTVSNLKQYCLVLGYIGEENLN